MDRYAHVALPIPFSKPFTYKIPEKFAEKVEIGSRVVVPVRRGGRVGFVVDIMDVPDYGYPKSIWDVLDAAPLFDEEALGLYRWIAEEYLTSIGEVIKAAVPTGTSVGIKKKVKLKALPEKKYDGIAAKIVKALETHGDLYLTELQKHVNKKYISYYLNNLESDGVIEFEIEYKRRVKPKTNRVISLCSTDSTFLKGLEDSVKDLRSKKQKEIIQHFLEDPEKRVSYTIIGKLYGYSVLKALMDKKILRDDEEEVFREGKKGWLEEELKDVELTKEQKNVLVRVSDCIDRELNSTILLHGVSASGKTRIYLEAAEKALRAGKGVLVLVPEISLTPQVWGRFKAKFGDKVGVLHSKLSPGERYDNWRRLRDGDLKIALGVRSAVFVPVKNLGLIIVDEEQDGSYKQDEPQPCYHAREVAIQRARRDNAVIVLGSATPSIESYHKALKGEYELYELPGRVTGGELPNINVVDLKDERKRKNFSSFSMLLKDKFVEQIEEGNQSMILLNRRGYASFLQCPDCGMIMNCTECEVPMTYHLNDYKLRCHYCGMEKDAPNECPECGSEKIRYKGRGTQRIEEDLLKYFDEEKIIRMDQDVTTGGREHADILTEFSSNKGTVLVGTQMIAKGLDFPEVTLVGVINADIGLSMPDFRAQERIFQLLMQVAGRAGRGTKKGEVVIQTYNPENPAVDYAIRHDYTGFYEQEIRQREPMGYPPFGRMVMVTASGDSRNSVITRITNLANDLKEALDETRDLRILGPAPAPFERLKGKYRWQLLIKGEDLKRAYPILKVLLRKGRGKVRVAVNVDPYTML
ncbi:primosomal protein N' [bacterium]|nr:primosomal protein N' [bacterium]